MNRIGGCVGGPTVTTKPSACESGAACILGFGEDTSMMPAMCVPLEPVPTFSQAYCSGWEDESVAIVNECLALPNNSVTMFDVFDCEQDGDLDMADLGPFAQAYDFVPKVEQSPAELLSVECCVPSAAVSEIAECLSGPDEHAQPAACSLEPLCKAEFSHVLEPGDRLYKICDPTPSQIAGPATCLSWVSFEQVPTFQCAADPLPGHSLFVVADVDLDEDVDLADYAQLMRGVQ